MNILAIIFLSFFCLSRLTISAIAEPKCEAGSSVTITGTIAQIYKGDTTGGPVWSITPSGQTGGCVVQFAYGTGPLPTNCIEGKRFTVSGQLLVAEIGDPDLDVSEIQCE